MTDDQKTQVKTYAKTINTNVVDGDLLDFVVDEVSDRVLLYLNDTAVPDGALRVIARVVAAVFNQTNNNTSNTSTEQAVKSISDNGQSITYSETVKSYLTNSDDTALFTGFEALLAPLRRPYVIAS